MATLADLQSRLARDLRDPSNATFSTTELTDKINAGFDAVADVYPREIVQSLGSIAAGTLSYSASSFTSIYRIDLYSSSSSYRMSVPLADGNGPDSGWEFHGGVVYIPPSWSWTAGDTLRAFGYGRYIALSATSDTTNADQAAINAALVHARWRALTQLATERSMFQQWQTESNNTDTTLGGILQAASVAAAEWREEQRRLRRLRKLG